MFGRGDYARKKVDAAKRSREQSQAGREIGDIPAIKHPRRRARAEKSLAYFCRAYLPGVFSLKFSADHLKAIARIESCMNDGGLYALAMPRGSGKTSLCETASIWGAITGRREFVVLIGASEGHASAMLANIKTALAANDDLADDWPEVCFPIRCLKGITQSARGQTHHGKSTHLQWTAQQVILPTIPNSQASGAIIRVAGITGHLRGPQHTRPDGRKVRPSLAIIDDPQTDESAGSQTQTDSRESVIKGAVLGMAGPKKKMAVCAAVTIIQPDDLSSRLLDRSTNQEWTGQTFKMVYEWPTGPEAADHWQRYKEIREEEFRADGDGRRATAYYRANRQAMEAGAVVAWPERHFSDELSALQHAYNLRFRDETSFLAEYQNEPPKAADAPTTVDPRDLAGRVNRYPRLTVPPDCHWITAGIDVQQNALYWLVAGWTERFGGHVIAYGCYPEQRRRYFLNRNITNTIHRKHPEAGFEGAIYAALEQITNQLLNHRYLRTDQSESRIQLLGIDANWGKSTDTVYRFCQQNANAAILYPTHGRFVGATSTPFSEYRRRPGERLGPGWRLPPASPGRTVRHVLFDTNHWKTFLRERWREPIGSVTALDLYGDDPTEHALFADHLTAEYSNQVTAKGRTVEEWQLKPGQDNHWLDCLNQAAALAAMLGADYHRPPAPPTRPAGEQQAGRPNYSRPGRRTAKPI